MATSAIIGAMSKKAAFYIPHYWTPHLEADLELMRKHVDAGDEVVAYICSGELLTCYANMTHMEELCNRCVNKRRNAFDVTGLGDKVQLRSFVNLKASDKEVLARYRGVKVETIEQLVDIKLENCPIGKTILNELISQTSESEPDLSEAEVFLTHAIESAALVYLSFKNHFEETRPDIFYTFNGRFIVADPAIWAAVATNTNYAVHDRAPGAMGRYSVIKNERLHSLAFWKKEIERTWNESKERVEERARIASEWFEARFNRQNQAWFSFTSEQSHDLPPGFDRQKTNVVIFNSSEFEMAAMDDYKSPFYKDQNDGAHRIASDLAGRSDVNVYFRVHPHLKGKGNSQSRFIEEKLQDRFQNFFVIPAESPISTYQLMLNSDLVITFASTTGVEAAYHRIPSLLMGRAWYEDLNCCNKVQSHDEAIELIVARRFKLSEDELDRRKQDALKYGYFSATYGVPYEMFEQTGIFEMKYKGANAPDSMITYDEPSYACGLKKEVAQRIELKTCSEPLAPITRELATVADKLTRENEDLRSELASVRAALEVAQVAANSRSRRYIHRVIQIKRSITHGIGRMLTWS
jgi:hypothetical protein